MKSPGSSARLSVARTVVLHGIFTLMILMAWYFFRERLYADSAYYIFHSIDAGSFVTANQRIVLAISEVMSLAVFYLGGSLHTILVAWSVSHVLFYYILFLVVYHGFKNETAAIAILLLQVIGQVWLYYSPMLEICYGAALLVVLSVVLAEKKFTAWRWCWLIVLEILVLTSHPENFVIFFFVVMADMIRNGFHKKIHLTFFLVLAGCMVFKTLTFSEYEGGKLGFMLDPQQNHLYENLWNLQYLRDVLGIFTAHYLPLLVFMAFAAGAMAYRRQWKMLALFLFCIAGLVVLINATNFAREFTRYNESLYYPVVTVAVIAFLEEFYAVVSNRIRGAVFFLVIGVTFYQLDLIRMNGEYLKLRTRQMENIILASRHEGVSKSLVRLENTEKERWVLNWSFPMESLLMSALDGPQGTVSVIADEDYDYRDTSVALTPSRFLLRRWEIRNDDDLLPLFRMNHGNYVPLNHADTTIASSLRGVSLELKPENAALAYSRIFIPVLVKNNSGIKIPSLPVSGNYFLVQVAGANRVSEMQIPLDIDLPEQYEEIVSCTMEEGSIPVRIAVKLIVHRMEIASDSISYNQ